MPIAASPRQAPPVARLLLCLGAAAVFAATPANRAAARADSPGPESACGGSGARVPYEPATFLGYACREADCEGHKAGFAWADAQGITDPRACDEAEDPVFAEGCRAFVEDAVTAEQSGFQWARENEVGDPCRCGGAGPRFEAGCEAYVLVVR
jgi:hypothetical protein